MKGKIKRTNKTTLLITELPIGKWTQNYRETVLEKMMAGGTDKADDKKKKRNTKKEENVAEAEEADKSSSEISDFKVRSDLHLLSIPSTILYMIVVA